MFIFQEPSDLILTNTDIASGSATVNASRTAYTYDLPYYMEKDFKEIQAKVVNRYIHQAKLSDRVHEIMFNSFPVIRPGHFKFRLKYVLPGINKTSSEVEVNVSY
jgi:hypothetical protein